MTEYIFTFGYGHSPFGIGTFVAITAPDSNSARAKMLEVYGRQWAFQYDSREEAGVDRFGLTCVDSLEVTPTTEEPDNV